MEAPLDALAGPVVQHRGFDDVDGQRTAIYDGVINAVQKKFPLQNATHRLEVSNLKYDDYNPTKADEKKAILSDGRMHRPLRGTVSLYDNVTNQKLDEQHTVLAHVPHLTNRGTFILNGSSWLVRNQARLRPGVYVRQQKSGGTEAHFNVKNGRGYRLELEPESGLFKLSAGQSTTRLYPLLRSLGATDDAIKEAWGEELFKKNYRAPGKNDLHDLRKVVSKFGKDGLEIHDDTAAQVLTELIGKSEVDEDTSELTLGERIKNLSPQVWLKATKKVLGVARGEQTEDNRDSQSFQSIHSAEDFFAERIHKDRVRNLNKVLWKASKEGKLTSLKPGALTPNLHGLFNGTGLAATPEETNPMEVADLRYGITRMGEGGISDTSAVSRDARGVQPSYAGLIDPVRAPESLKIGLDLRAAGGAFKGSDNQLYAQVRNVKTGIIEKVPSRTLESAPMAFPGELGRPGKRVRAIVGSEIKYVDRKDIKYELPSGSDMLSPVTQMVPFPQTMKGARLAMASRMTAQALPVTNAEAPYVQGATQDGLSMHDKYAAAVGAVKSTDTGRVISVTPDAIIVQTATGEKKSYETYNNLPGARKTVLHNTAMVKPGDMVRPGQLLAKSNYTDDKGLVAIGKNLRVGYLPAHGATHEDGVVISESAAKKMTSEQAYQMELDLDGIKSTKKADFTAIYGPKFTKDQFANIDDDGVIKVGTKVKSGDPLVLGIGNKQPRALGAIMKSERSPVSDKTVTWEHEAEGEVVDIKRTKAGVSVVVKSITPTKLGDKFCYSADHEVLTTVGWVPVAELTVEHSIASRTPSGDLEYVNPTTIHEYEHEGKMYSLETTQVSLLVTDNHKLLVSMGHHDTEPEDFELVEAKDVAGRNFKMSAAVTPKSGVAPAKFKFPSYTAKAGQSGNGTRLWEGAELEIEAFAWLLGAWLSEGNCVWDENKGSYGIELTQKKPEGVAELRARIAKYGYNFKICQDGKFRWLSKSMALFFKELQKGPETGRHCYNKRIPSWVFEWPAELLQVLFDALMWGDGSRGKTADIYTTTSVKLAGDIQRLALHLGFAATVRTTPARLGRTPTSEVCWCHERYDVVMRYTKVCPEINHSHAKTQGGQTEQWVDFNGPVYCPELPRNHTIYVRRNGKPIWCGNSMRWGNKGVVSDILPDGQMPHDEQGRPLEVLLNPVGVTSRTNPGVLVEALLGKIAEKTGKPYIVPAFAHDNATEYALAEAQKHGVSELETLTDSTGRKIPNIFTGNLYTMKLHHLAESKMSARDTATYDNYGSPAKGGYQGSKRISMLDIGALLSSGATNFLKDAKLVRGQRNDDYWRAVKTGTEPMAPTKTFANDHFKALLKSAGVNIKEEGTKQRLSPMLDKDVNELAQHEIENSDTFDFTTMKPVPGGLFDIAKTGGADGNRFAKITLPTKIPHPLFFEPIARVLGLTLKGMEGVLSGKEELYGKTGPEAIEKALAGINIDHEMIRHRNEVRSGSASKRDAAVRALGFLQGFKTMGINPSDLMISKIPVIPPKFRPIARTPTSDVTHDLNYLYHDLMEAKKNYSKTDETLGDAGQQYLTMYKAAKAIVGTGEPINPKHQEQELRGLLGFAIGVGESPKGATYQRRVMGTSLDTVGRSVITVDPSLKMDEISMPKQMAWDTFRPYIIRRLVRNGNSASDAVMAVKNQTKAAQIALEAEMKERPVVYNRAPALHRYAYVGGYAKLNNSNSIHVNNAVLSGLGADQDGDTINIHIPSGKDAVQDIHDKLMPSKNLWHSGTFDVHHDPKQDYVAGLYLATQRDDSRPVKEFATEDEAIKAYARGEISARDPVRILSSPK